MASRHNVELFGRSRRLSGVFEAMNTFGVAVLHNISGGILSAL